MLSSLFVGIDVSAKDNKVNFLSPMDQRSHVSLYPIPSQVLKYYQTRLSK
jgi:hypothetical protein